MRRKVVVFLSLSSLLLIMVSAVPLRAQHPVGAVYIITNDPNSNAVLVFNRAEDGTLRLVPFHIACDDGRFDKRNVLR